MSGGVDISLILDFRKDGADGGDRQEVRRDSSRGAHPSGRGEGHFARRRPLATPGTLSGGTMPPLPPPGPAIVEMRSPFAGSVWGWCVWGVVGGGFGVGGRVRGPSFSGFPPGT